jgi:hypothetical protein
MWHNIIKHTFITRMEKSQNKNIIEFSQFFLEELKKECFDKELLKTQNEISLYDLKTGLTNDTKKKTFWINIYNAFIRISLKNPDLITIYPKEEFFTQRNINFKDINLSFDDIEHGILRKSSLKSSKGYASKIKAHYWEEELRVEELDYRIHFALNCGAKSCPPIKYYSEKKLESQLTQAERSFLLSDSEFMASNTLYLSNIFLSYEGDFSGIEGILNLHKKYKIVPEEIPNKDIIIKYHKYNWDIL